jgi:hypothetical protein
MSRLASQVLKIQIFHFVVPSSLACGRRRSRPLALAAGEFVLKDMAQSIHCYDQQS